MDCRHIDHPSRQGKVNSRKQMLKSAGLHFFSDWLTGSLQTNRPSINPTPSPSLFSLSANLDFALLKSQSRSSQPTCINPAVFDGEDCRDLPCPLCIRRRTILSSIAFDCRQTWNPRGQTARMEERCAGTRQILNAQKHAELLCCRRHQQRF